MLLMVRLLPLTVYLALREVSNGSPLPPPPGDSDHPVSGCTFGPDLEHVIVIGPGSFVRRTVKFNSRQFNKIN